MTNSAFSSSSILNRNLAPTSDLGMIPLTFINYGIPNGFISSKNVTIPDFTSSSPHMKVTSLKLVTTSEGSSKVQIHYNCPLTDCNQYTSEWMKWKELDIDYSDIWPRSEKHCVDVKINYYDKDNNEIYQSLSPSYTLVPQDSALLNTKFRYIDAGDVYLKLIVTGFKSDENSEAINYIKKNLEISTTIAHEFEAIKQIAEAAQRSISIGKTPWKSKSTIIEKPLIVEFEYFGKNKDDRLIATGDSSTHDLFDGNDGNDEIICRRGRDIAHGGKGDDILKLGNGSDIGYGGTGKDIVNGGFGRNTIYNTLDGDKDIVTFKSDEWATNWLYSSRKNQDGTKIDLIIGGDPMDEYRIIHDDDIQPKFSYADNYSAKISGETFKGTGVFLNGVLEAMVVGNNNLSSFSYISNTDNSYVSFFF